MSKGAKHEISFHFACTLIQTTHFLIMAKTKKTLQKEEKIYWEKHGFDDKLRRQLNWKQWEYNVYETFMAKQKNQNSQLQKNPQERSFLKPLLKRLQLLSQAHQRKNVNITLELLH